MFKLKEKNKLCRKYMQDIWGNFIRKKKINNYEILQQDIDEIYSQQYFLQNILHLIFLSIEHENNKPNNMRLIFILTTYYHQENLNLHAYKHLFFVQY